MPVLPEWEAPWRGLGLCIAVAELGWENSKGVDVVQDPLCDSMGKAPREGGDLDVGQWKQLDNQLLMNIMDISSFKRLRDCIASVCISCYVISAHRSALGVCPAPL